MIFLVLPINTKGRDLRIADLHANDACLGDVIKILSESKYNRLIIGGDAVDRDEVKGRETIGDSVAVIELIRKYPDQIFLVRGNHEDMAQNTIRALHELYDILDLEKAEKGIVSELTEDDFKRKARQLVKAGDSDTAKLMSSFLNHCKEANGGGWLLQQYVEEANSDKIIVTTLGQAVKIEFSADSKISMLEAYFNSLPTIITHEGNMDIMPSHVVHAKMPINDEELNRRIAAGDKKLTPEEKDDAIWSREEGDVVGRDSASTLAYCGHTIVMDQGVPCVRVGTSMVNLDAAAYLYSVSIMVDHVTREAFLVGPGVELHQDADDPIREKLEQIRVQVKNYLDFRFCKYKKEMTEKDIFTAREKDTPEKIYTRVKQGLNTINEMIDKLNVFLPSRPNKNLTMMGVLRTAIVEESFDSKTNKTLLALYVADVVRNLKQYVPHTSREKESYDGTIKNLNNLIQLFNEKHPHDKLQPVGSPKPKRVTDVKSTYFAETKDPATQESAPLREMSPRKLNK